MACPRRSTAERLRTQHPEHMKALLSCEEIPTAILLSVRRDGRFGVGRCALLLHIIAGGWLPTALDQDVSLHPLATQQANCRQRTLRASLREKLLSQ